MRVKEVEFDRQTLIVRQGQGRVRRSLGPGMVFPQATLSVDPRSSVRCRHHLFDQTACAPTTAASRSPATRCWDWFYFRTSGIWRFAGELKPAGGIIGAGFEERRWPRPVRPGDELRVESEVLEVRASQSRPEQGTIKVKTTTLNQNNEPVQVFVGSLVVPRRPGA